MKARAKLVLPAPSSPLRAITSPGRASAAIWAASAAVAASLGSSMTIIAYGLYISEARARNICLGLTRSRPPAGLRRRARRLSWGDAEHSRQLRCRDHRRRAGGAVCGFRMWHARARLPPLRRVAGARWAMRRALSGKAD